MELSTKELKLLKLICDEYKNLEIAEEFGYGLRHVEKLKASLFKKTNTTSNIGLLKMEMTCIIHTFYSKFYLNIAVSYI